LVYLYSTSYSSFGSDFLVLGKFPFLEGRF